MAMFQQRHFEAIAIVLQKTHSEDAGDGGGADVWQHMRNELADLFASDNSHFDRGRFERACVPGANVRKRT